MTPDDAWLSATWPFVQSQLPRPPGTVLEIGCGPLGGFVPTLNDSGYRAIGVDPAAPDGPEYERATFEKVHTPEPFDAVVACTSLHHVDDLDDDRRTHRTRGQVRGGTIIVVEWAWELFDERTALVLRTPRVDCSRNRTDLAPSSPRRLASLWAILDTYLRGWAGEHHSIPQR